MAKKFGKFLLFTAAVGTAAAAAYYFMQKKDSTIAESNDNDEDYDDFSEDLEDDAETTRNYVSLNLDNASTTEASEDVASEADEFTPLAEQLTEDSVEETCEEFFDEDDTSEEDLPIED